MHIWRARHDRDAYHFEIAVHLRPLMPACRQIEERSHAPRHMGVTPCLGDPIVPPGYTWPTLPGRSRRYEIRQVHARWRPQYGGSVFFDRRELPGEQG